MLRRFLGDLIELREVTNSNLEFGIDFVRGVNNLKKLIKTKADLNGRDISKFQVVQPGEFVFNHRTSRNGSKFSIAYNDEENPVICTEDYVVFRIKPECAHIILADWLYMYLNRPEFDRYVITNSWGSSTEFYNWEDLCSIELDIPPLSIQNKYVNIYITMVANQKAYDKGLDDLKLACDAFIENLRLKMPCKKIGHYIAQKNERNSDKKINKVMGLSTKKSFRVPNSRVNVDELGKYKIVQTNEIAFVPTTDTWKVLAFAVNEFDEPIVVSPIYEVIHVDETILKSQYLAMWLNRKEFDRYARFHSWGSARENFSYNEMTNIEIPIPSIDIQEAIVNIFNTYNKRKDISERLKVQIIDLCPVLIKGSIEEAKKEE